MVPSSTHTHFYCYIHDICYKTVSLCCCGPEGNAARHNSTCQYYKLRLFHSFLNALPKDGKYTWEEMYFFMWAIKNTNLRRKGSKNSAEVRFIKQISSLNIVRIRAKLWPWGGEDMYTQTGTKPLPYLLKIFREIIWGKLKKGTTCTWFIDRPCLKIQAITNPPSGHAFSCVGHKENSCMCTVQYK